MSKEQLLQEFAQAYEHLMETASLAAQRWPQKVLAESPRGVEAVTGT